MAAASVIVGSVIAEAAGLKSLEELRRPTPFKETFVYKRVDGRDLTLDLYPPAGRFPTSALPAVVFIHGGGWSSGSPDHFAPHCRYFASRGIMAANVSYRLTQGYFPDRPAVTVFDCIADVQEAIRWLRAEAPKRGIDPGRIAVAGDSAGGHLAAAAAILPDPGTGKVDPACVPDALLLCNPVLDFTTLSWTANTPGIREKSGAEREAAAKRASPLLHLRPGLPPALVLHGTADKVVPSEQARRFQEGMKKAGNRCDAVFYDGVDHAFVLLDYYPDEAAVKRAIVDMDRFLGSLGWLAGAPSLAAAEPAAGSTIVHPKDGAVMVYVPAGPAVIGLDPEEAETVAKALGAKDADQLWMWECYPKRTVNLPGYYIDRTEVTVGQWEQYVKETGFTNTPKEVVRHFGKPEARLLPVGEIPQEAARAYAAWAGKALPTDEQWEKACRGTDGRFWPWGNTPPTPELANLGPHTRERSYEPVGSHPKGASPYGCLDMVGNQYEWTDGTVTPYPGNPMAAKMAEYNSSANRCVRGGSFYHGFKSGYACKRMGFEGNATYFHLGFRCVWVPPAE